MLFHLFDPLNQVITGDEPFEVFLRNPEIEKFEHLLTVLLITPWRSEDIKTTDNLGCTILQFKLCLTEILSILVEEFEACPVSVIADMTVLEVISMLDALFPDLRFLVVFLVLSRRIYDPGETGEHGSKKEDQENVSHYIFVHS